MFKQLRISREAKDREIYLEELCDIFLHRWAKADEAIKELRQLSSILYNPISEKIVNKSKARVELSVCLFKMRYILRSEKKALKNLYDALTKSNSVVSAKMAHLLGGRHLQPHTNVTLADIGFEDHHDGQDH